MPLMSTMPTRYVDKYTGQVRDTTGYVQQNRNQEAAQAQAAQASGSPQLNGVAAYQQGTPGEINQWGYYVPYLGAGAPPAHTNDPEGGKVYNIGNRAWTRDIYNNYMWGQAAPARAAQAQQAAAQKAQQEAFTRQMADQQAAGAKALAAQRAQATQYAAPQVPAYVAPAYQATQTAAATASQTWANFSGQVAQAAYAPVVAASAQPDPAIAAQKAAADKAAKDAQWARDDAASKAQQAKNFKAVTSNTSWLNGRSEQDVQNYRQYQEQFYASLLGPTPDQSGMTRGGAGPLRG